MKIAFFTLGCKVNQYETQAMSELVAKNGYEVVEHSEKADIYVINSCTVTAESDKKTRQAVRRFKRNNPESVVILTGCMPQAYPEAAESLKEADIIIGNKNDCNILDVIDDYFLTGQRIFKVTQHQKGDNFIVSPISKFNERTRAFVKIQDGCNRFCSYCIIPTSRGRVRSKPIEEIKLELESLAENGYKEIVLVGINLSSYGQDFDNGLNICDAVECACSIEKIERVRLGSLEPDHITKEVIESWAKQEKLCPQFHISLQSGCDETLKRMNRHYNTEEYRQLCKNLRENFKDCSLTTDVMVGFSGETDEEFEKSLDFVKEIGFEKVHIFPYSVRVGTRAEHFENQVEKCVKEKRASIMQQECAKIRADFLKRQIGKEVEVLLETRSTDGKFEGYTPNYTPVLIENCNGECGNIVKAKIIDISGDACIGEKTN
ncbi:MAG: tRNA (N(6)-L-threonylcarbamoyladenosine(37)-C(2))-methylthiotransferase MtaB [Clostridiales bacterium]|nr:tRNA (N(6)-L-threonylcarbamoyladenosine(37)-C(2))-methylthiotransferase MtaB [Clostridiales bacterium]